MRETFYHLKRESQNPHRSNAYDKTLCGREDPGVHAYATVEPGEAVPDTGAYKLCPECVEEHGKGAEK